MKLNTETLSLVEFYPEFRNLKNVISLMKLSDDPYSQDNINSLLTPTITDLYQELVREKLFRNINDLRIFVLDLSIFLRNKYFTIDVLRNHERLKIFSPNDEALIGIRPDDRFVLRKKLLHLNRYYGYSISSDILKNIMSDENIEYAMSLRLPFYVTFFDYSQENLSAEESLRIIELNFNLYEKTDI